jgi:hypothetical protein
VLKRPPSPFLAQKSLTVEFDQKPAGIQTAACREILHRGRGADLAGVTVDKDAQSTMNHFRHNFSSAFNPASRLWVRASLRGVPAFFYFGS